MQVASRKGWLVVLALTLVVVSAVVWGVFGSIPTHVAGSGILLFSGGGVRQVVAVGPGELQALAVKVGDLVEPGQVLARAEVPLLRQEVEDARRTLATLEADRQRIVSYYQGFSADQDRLYAETRKNTEALIAGNERQVAVNQRIVAGYEKLLRQSYTTSVEVEAARERLFEIQAELDQNRQKLASIEIQYLEQKNERIKTLESYDLQISTAQGKLSEAELQLSLAEEVRSPLAGRVVEVDAEIGSTLAAGTPILLIEFGQPVLEATLYMPAGTGKEIAVGMPANVAPATVKKDHFGTMIGRVVLVGEYPATESDMMRVLNNQSLVQALAASGPPLVVHARLERDAATYSGYRWSSSEGPPVKVSSGTEATATVTVRTQPPISLVIPAIRRFLGVEP